MTMEAFSGRFSDARLSLLLADPNLGKGAMPGLAKLLAHGSSRVTSLGKALSIGLEKFASIRATALSFVLISLNRSISSSIDK